MEKIFDLAVTVTINGRATVKARTLEEAIEKAEYKPKPFDPNNPNTFLPNQITSIPPIRFDPINSTIKAKELKQEH